MKEKLISIVKNFSYSLSSNLISLIISTLVVLVVPRIIGVEDYGFWQLYLFYSSYIGFLHFGWNDGIYLRYGGEEYDDLDKPVFFSQFYSLLFLQIILALLISIFSFNLINDGDRLFILQIIAIEIVVVNTRYMLMFILQATNRIKDYSKITILDRLLYVSLIIFLLIFGVSNYKLLIVSDLIGKTASFFVAMYLCKDIVFRRVSDFKNTFDETVKNINVGIKLMFSNIANNLVIGVVRFGIERNWSVAVFGQISLTLSVSNMFLMFINALGLVIYPILRRINQNSLAKVYSVMRDLLMAFVIGILIFYMPIKIVLSQWLPQYAESLNYMAMLFPIMIYQSKMSLLINTYMKALRYEKRLLQINIITMVFSFILTFISTSMMDNLDLAILSIVMLMAFRGIASELYLSSTLNINVIKDILLELMMAVIFIYTAWVINSWMTPLIYGAFYIVYLLIKRNDLKESADYIVRILKS
ncbi:lipopolysaccharide biosynthesis protein [Aerococcus urinaeequi]|uniref:lipopolysaccharide biosynthesis protein n=1 Tax=Aerococcus urinaeequi TaxID=51665 RepID=UPI003B3A9607